MRTLVGLLVLLLCPAVVYADGALNSLNNIAFSNTFVAAQTDLALVSAPDSGTRIVVTAAAFACSNANTVNVSFTMGTASGVGPTPTTTNVVLRHPNVAAGSGITRGDGGSAILVGGLGHNLFLTMSVPTTGACDVMVTYQLIRGF